MRVRIHGTFVLWKVYCPSVSWVTMVLVSGACACSLLSVLLCTRIGVLVPGFTVLLVDYSLDYVLHSVHCLLDYALC